MPLFRILPYVAILVVGQAVLDAGPAIVAEREGGMGLGSALIGALVTQVAGIVLGATVAGYVVDRGSATAGVLLGAFLYYLGLMATFISPMGALGSVMVGMGVGGIGFGAMLTAAFSVAAAVEPRRARAAAVVLLLAAPIVARLAVGTAFAAGSPAFLVGGAAVVGLALIGAHLAGPEPAATPSSHDRAGARKASASRAALSAGLLAIGALLAVAGSDPSRLSASLIARPLGLSGFDTIDAARAVLVGIGIALVLVAANSLLASAGRMVRMAVPGLLLAGFAGAGIGAALAQAALAGRVQDGTSALIGVATAVGGGLGLASGWMLIARGLEPRSSALFGSAVLFAACAIGWVLLLGQRPEPGAITPTVVIGIAGLALGLAASALRLVLTDVEPRQRGLAAGAGVVAAVLGSVLGGMIGAAEGLSTLGGESRGVAIGLLGFVIAAAVAVAMAAALPGGKRANPRLPEQDRLSQAPR